MKLIPILLTLFGLTACTTSIAALSLPTPSTIMGTVTRIEDGGFYVKDHSGEIKVDAGDSEFSPALKIGELIAIRGVVDEDDSEGQKTILVNEMDAYDIWRADGSRIIVIPYD